MFAKITKSAFMYLNAVDTVKSILSTSIVDVDTFASVTSYGVTVDDTLCGGFACSYNAKLHGVDRIVISKAMYAAYLRGELVEFIEAIIKHEEGHIVFKHNSVGKYRFAYNMIMYGYNEHFEYEADRYSVDHGYDMASALTELCVYYGEIGNLSAVRLLKARLGVLS